MKLEARYKSQDDIYTYYELWGKRHTGESVIVGYYYINRHMTLQYSKNEMHEVTITPEEVSNDSKDKELLDIFKQANFVSTTTDYNEPNPPIKRKPVPYTERIRRRHEFTDKELKGIICCQCLETIAPEKPDFWGEWSYHPQCLIDLSKQW